MNNKERILEAAQELFFRQGIRAVTMDDIASHIGISKKTLYAEFSEKDQVVLKLLDKYLEEKQCEFTRIAEKSEDAILEILHIMEHMSEMFRHINPHIFYDMQKYYPAAWKKFRKFKQDCMMGMIEQNMHKGIQQGLYRKEINIKILSRLRIEEVELALHPDIFPAKEFNMTEVHIALLEHFLFGIATIKGFNLITQHKQQLFSKTLL
jgi:AcrR family transcriptional regulator